MPAWRLNNVGVQHNKGGFLLGVILFKKNLNASKPSEHPPSGGKMSKGLGGNIGCRDNKTSLWYQGFANVTTSGQQYNIEEKPSVIQVH